MTRFIKCLNVYFTSCLHVAHRRRKDTNYHRFRLSWRCSSLILIIWRQLIFDGLPVAPCYNLFCQVSKFVVIWIDADSERTVQNSPTMSFFITLKYYRELIPASVPLLFTSNWCRRWCLILLRYNFFPSIEVVLLSVSEICISAVWLRVSNDLMARECIKWPELDVLPECVEWLWTSCVMALFLNSK